MFADDIELFYADGDLVTPEGGTAFWGFFAVRDVEAFDAPVMGDYQLQYPAARSLSKGSLLDIGGVQYRVAEQPKRIGDGGDMVVGLFEERA